MSGSVSGRVSGRVSVSVSVSGVEWSGSGSGEHMGGEHACNEQGSGGITNIHYCYKIHSNTLLIV